MVQNLETGASPIVNLESEALRMISMDCQIEANPSPSYIWYEMLSNNVTSGMMPYYGNQNPYGNQYPLQPPSNMPTSGLSVFGTTRQIQRLYQNPGQHVMQCQAQSRGKTIKQEFIITVNRKFAALTQWKEIYRRMFCQTMLFTLKAYPLAFSKTDLNPIMFKRKEISYSLR